MSKPTIINDITPEELQRFKDIDDNCLAMHVPCPPKTFITLQVHDKDGNLEYQYDTRSKSWVRNAYNVSAQVLLDLDNNETGTTYGEGKLCTKATDGTVNIYAGKVLLIDSFNTGTYLAAVHAYHGAAGIDTKGIVVGTGTTAESFENTTLATKILNGGTTGTLAYSASNAPLVSYDSGTKKWTVQLVRFFNNNSGGAIDVNELGMYANEWHYGPSNKQLMMWRDVLGSPVTVNNTAQLTVTYTMEYIFPN